MWIVITIIVIIFFINWIIKTSSKKVIKTQRTTIEQRLKDMQKKGMSDENIIKILEKETKLRLMKGLGFDKIEKPEFSNDLFVWTMNSSHPCSKHKSLNNQINTYSKWTKFFPFNCSCSIVPYSELQERLYEIFRLSISVKNYVYKPNFVHETGSIVSTKDGGFILNPKSLFPLTFYGIDAINAKKLKELLDTGCLYNDIISIIAKSNLVCKEINEYIEKFKPQYISKIEQIKNLSMEWATSSKKKKEKLLIDFCKQAIASLDTRPCCDLQILFEYEFCDNTIDSDLISQFGYENLQTYFSYAKSINKVHIIPNSSHKRNKFEKLLEVGLALSGNDVSLESILRTLSLKKMNEIVIDLKHPNFNRKNKAIEFLIKLSDIKERISKVVVWEDIFQLKSLPEKFLNVNLKQTLFGWRYVNEIAKLILHTYIIGRIASYYTHVVKKYIAKNKNASIKGWKLSIENNDIACPYCKRIMSENYSKTEFPQIPLHIGGCIVNVAPITSKGIV